MDNKTKAYLFVAIITFTFIFILLIDWFIVGTVIGLSVTIVLMVGTVRRDRAVIRVAKVGIFVLCFFILTNPWPAYWIPQFERRWGKNRCNLIDPSHPVFPGLNTSFNAWFEDKNGFSFEEEPDFESRVRSVDLYVRRERFDYTLDQIQYRASFDYLPTIDEILATEDADGKWHDDCDGISIVTCSFLLYLGYNAYISEITYHYHTIVFPDGSDPKTTEGYLAGVSLYRGSVLPSNDDKQSYYLFNETSLFIPPTRPLLQSIGEILVDGNVWKRDVYEIFSGDMTGLPVWLNYILVGFVCCFLGFGLNIYARAGLVSLKRQPNRREHRWFRFSIAAGLILFLALVFNNLLATFYLTGGPDLTYLCNPVLILVCTSLLFLANRKIPSNP